MNNSSLISSLSSQADFWEKSLDLNRADLLSAELIAKAPLITLWQEVVKSDPGQVALALPKMTQEQRQGLIDLDQWSKDKLNLEHFDFWPKVYAACSDDNVVEEFLSSDSFLLLLKGRFTIASFDVEDPQYPDHDRYFLTEDGLLIFEYDEEFDSVEEVKILLRRLTSFWGVERAYAHLFKMVSECFTSFEEDCYQEKKRRLEDLGMVDYYDALKLESVFASESQIQHYLTKTLDRVDGGIPDIANEQVLSSGQLKAFQKENSGLDQELALVVSTSRQKMLRFNFIQLLNSRLSFSQADLSQRIDLLLLGKESLVAMELGLEYAKSFFEGKVILEEGIFQKLNFQDLYRIGNSLVKISQKKTKNLVARYGWEDLDKEAFLGKEINESLDSLLAQPPRLRLFFHEEGLEIRTLRNLDLLRAQVEFFEKLFPFAQKIWENFQKMVSDGRVANAFFLNYQILDIDLEAILCSGFTNFVMKVAQGDNGQHLFSVRPETVLQLGKNYFSEELSVEEKISRGDELKELAISFCEDYGLNIVENMPEFLTGIMKREFEGNQWGTLLEKDLAHVGGPIILA